MVAGKSMLGGVAMVAFAALPSLGASITVSDDSTIAVDVRSGSCRALSPGKITYAPGYCGVTDEGAYVVIEKVEHADTASAVTNVLPAFAADAEGEYSLSVDDGGERRLRLIHRVYSSEGEEIGTPLVRDVVFGYKSALGTAFAADTCTTTLQALASARIPIKPTYSTMWATNASEVSISAVKLSGRNGTAVATNIFFSAEADAEGVASAFGAGGGWYRLLCRISDDADSALVEYLTTEFEMPYSFVLSIR